MPSESKSKKEEPKAAKAAKKAKASATAIVSRDLVVRASIQNIVSDLGTKYLSLAFLLHEVWENTYFIKYGYSSLKDYCEQEVKTGFGKARKLIAVAEKVKAFNLNEEDVEEIGWTKMSMIEGVLTDKNTSALIKKAKEKSVAELSEEVRSYREGVLRESTDRVITLTVKLTEDQSSIIMDALDKAKKEVQTESIALALEHMAYSWTMSSNEEATVPMEAAIAWVEKSFGVTLEVVSQKSINERVDAVSSLEGGLR